MKPFIVVSDGFDAPLFEELKKCDALEVHPKSKVTQDELKALLPKINGLIIRSATKVDAALLELAPNLKLVIRAGEGTDNIDKVACAAKGVKVANTPGANSNSAAEHAIAIMFTLLRKTAWAHASTKGGKWEKSAFEGNEVWKKKIGFVGFGKIGQIVAKRLSGFEPEVFFYDPMIETSPLGKKAQDMKEIFSKCDIITMHLPLIPATKGIVNKDLLGLMKKDAVLINASRGGIVNEDDLYTTLKEKKILGAAFDVFADEPLKAESKLFELDNLVMTPHLGASTSEAQYRVGEMAVHQIKEFFLNNNMMNEVKAK